MKHQTLPILGAAFVLCPFASAATLYWSDTYNVTTSSQNVNAEYATRQTGTPVQYVANSSNPASDYHHQVFAPGGANQPLQLAGDSGLLIARVSPNQSFTGTAGGEIIGKQISFSLNVGVAFGGGSSANKYTSAGITVGSNATLAGIGLAGSGFGIRFVEDTFSNPTVPAYFVQLFDDATLIGNFTNPAGVGTGTVDIEIEGVGDGNPWDGVGNATVLVKVNNNALTAAYTKVGGYTSNYLTLEGTRNSNNALPSLVTHQFDNLSVYSVIPEPSAALLGSLGLLGLLRRRR